MAVVTKTVTATGLVYSAGCELHGVAVSKAGGSAGTVTVSDSTTTSTPVIAVVDAQTVMSYPLGNFAGGGTTVYNGLYVTVSAGTPEVLVTYEP